MTTVEQSTAPVLRTDALPVHPRRAGWRAGAAAALVASAVSELRAGRSPHRDVRALAQLGGGNLRPGLAAAAELDRRLAAAVTPLMDDLLLHRACAAAACGPVDSSALLSEDLADVVVGTLFDSLPPHAVTGCPHPGEWVASSVDVVPCAVHGYEDGPVDCLRRSARSHLVAVVDRAAGVPSWTVGTLGEQVITDRAAHRDDLDASSSDPVLTALWTGVATLAAWQAHAATL